MNSPSHIAPCFCGSGKKYQDCCLGKTGAIQQAPLQEMSGQTETQLLQTAMQHHHAGRLPQAEAVYQRILQISPSSVDALHLSGLSSYQTGRIGAAIELISKALSIKPASPMYYNLAAAFSAQGAPYVTINGYLTPCCTIFDESLYEQDNLIKNDIEAAWKMPAVSNWLKSYVHEMPDACNGCCFNPFY